MLAEIHRGTPLVLLLAGICLAAPFVRSRPPAPPAPEPAAEPLPLIEINAIEITYQGQLVAVCDAVTQDDGYKLDALYERLDASTKKILNFPFHPIERPPHRGPLRVLVHYEPGCSLVKVRRALNAIWAAHYTMVLTDSSASASRRPYSP